MHKFIHQADKIEYFICRVKSADHFKVKFVTIVGIILRDVKFPMPYFLEVRRVKYQDFGLIKKHDLF